MEHRILLIRDAEDRLQSVLLQNLGDLRFRSGGYLRCELLDAQNVSAAFAHLTPQCAVALQLPLAVVEDSIFLRSGEAADRAALCAQLAAIVAELEGKSLVLLPHLDDYQAAPEALQAALAAVQQAGIPMIIGCDHSFAPAALNLPQADILEADAAAADFLPLLLDWLEACRAKARSDRYDHAYKQHYDNEPSRPQNQQPAKKKRTLLDWKPRELYED